MIDIVSIPYLTIHPTYIVAFSQLQHTNGNRYVPRRKHNLPVDKDHKGIISSKAASKIKKRVDYILYQAKTKQIIPANGKPRFTFRVGFVTLTLSSEQVHKDSVIKKECLNQFLIEARNRWNIRNYLWRAEAQKNGNIHFHILVDQFIPWSELRDAWNRIQNKLGYVDRYRDQMNAFHSGGFKVRDDLLRKWSYKKQVQAYKLGSRQDWNSPNSTDVHKVRKIRDLSAYLGKYCTKNDGPRQISGRLWGSSENLSKLTGAVLLRDSAIDSAIGELMNQFPDRVRQSDYFLVIYITPKELAMMGSNLLYYHFMSYLKSLNSS